MTLPRRINWSRTDPTYDLTDRRQRVRVYEQVLREGTAADVRYIIDVNELINLWDDLVLPPAVSSARIDWLAATATSPCRLGTSSAQIVIAEALPRGVRQRRATTAAP